MAQLKDSLITGDLRVTGTIYGDVPLNDLVDADDLKAIEVLSGTSGILTKTAANTWSLVSSVTPSSHDHDSAYVKKSGDTMTNYLTIKHASAAKLVTEDTTSTGKVFYGFGSAHQNHGIYSYGYAPTQSSWTTDEKWMVYRNSSGDIILNGNATTATGFASAKTIALTGNVTGSATGGNGSNGWSIATTIGSGVVTNAMLAGSIANGKLVNSKVTIAGNDVSLGGSLAAATLKTSLGLSSAMHYIGKATVAITDGSTTDPKIGGNATTLASGDVVIDNSDSREYVWNGSKWELLGGDSSYKVTQTAVTDAAYSGSDTATIFVSAVTQNANGEISVTKRKLPVASTSTAGIIKIGTDSTDAAAGNHTHSYLPLSGGTLTGGLSGTTLDMSGAIVGGGDITFGNGTTAALIAKTPSRTGSILLVGGGRNTAGDANGTVIRLQGGGLMMVGGGEYPTNRYNVGDLSDKSETAYFGADGAVYIETNANTIANRKTYTFGTDGSLDVPGTIKQDGVAVSLSTHTHTISNHSVTTPTGATSRTADVALNTTTVNSITAVGTLPSLTVTATDVVTGGTTTAIPNISKKTVVTGVTKKTVVTGGSTTAVPNISKKTVVTSATAAKATYSSGVLTISDGSVTTGDSVTVGTAINAYTSLTTGDSVTVTTGDSVTVGTAINAYTALTTSSIGSASGWSAGTLPTKGSNTTVATGIKTQPTFSVTTTTTTLSHTLS